MIKHSRQKPVSSHADALQRRGWQLGWVAEQQRPDMPDSDTIQRAWRADASIMLPGIVDVAGAADDIARAHRLMEQTLDGVDLETSFEQPEYQSGLQAFQMVGVSTEDHDEQAIEKLYFDVEQEGNCIAESLWCKASWLSFHDDDASLRFRFSFGMEGFEDVAADPLRQQWAGTLCDAMFPESRVITENTRLLQFLHPLLGAEPAFVERIVYFNAPNGGAQMHHDVERGHAGVVYAQLSGATFWLALSKPLLMDELVTFVGNEDDALAEVLPEAGDRQRLQAMLADRDALSAYLEEADHELVEAVMDRSPAFVGHLVQCGYGYCLEAGDVLLMPQRDLDTCVWHSVFCLGDEPGEALSFAVRPA